MGGHGNRRLYPLVVSPPTEGGCSLSHITVSYTHLDVYKRQLLDAGSQINFCTKSFARKLQLKLTKSNIPITGINNTACYATDLASISIISRYQRYSFEAKCAILSTLTHNLPANSFDINQFHIPNKIFLADPDFNISSQIDILSVSYTHLDVYKRQELCVPKH